MNEPFDVTLDNCHKEPIHIPGSIQPHGYLMVFEAETLVLRYGSQNLADLMARPIDELIGLSLTKLLDNDFGDRVRL